jgi:hypothetical protein
MGTCNFTILGIWSSITSTSEIHQPTIRIQGNDNYIFGIYFWAIHLRLVIEMVSIDGVLHEIHTSVLIFG